MSKVLFQAPQSSFDPSFWEKLYDLKLNVLKLDSAERGIFGFISCSDGKHHQSIEFNLNSHHDKQTAPKIDGHLLNVNTVEVSPLYMLSTAPLQLSHYIIANAGIS